MIAISAMRAISQAFDRLVTEKSCFLVDIWGVLFDGEYFYDQVIETLLKVRSAGKQVILISNTSRSSSAIKELINSSQIEPHFFDHIVTSGDVACRLLNDSKMVNRLGICYWPVGGVDRLDWPINTLCQQANQIE